MERNFNSREYVWKKTQTMRKADDILFNSKKDTMLLDLKTLNARSEMTINNIEKDSKRIYKTNESQSKKTPFLDAITYPGRKISNSLSNFTKLLKDLNLYNIKGFTLVTIALIFLFSVLFLGVNTLKENQITSELTIEDIEASKQEIINAQDTQAVKLENSVNDEITVYSLIVGDSRQMYFQTEDQAQEALEKIREEYSRGDNTVVEFKESVGIKETIIASSEDITFETTDTAIEKMKRVSNDERIYMSKPGDTLWSIADSYGMNIKDIIEYNPQLTTAFISEGTEINLAKSSAMITIRIKETVNEIEYEDYAVDSSYDNSMYTYERKVITKGQKGETHYVYDIISENGKVVEEKLVSKEKVSEPVTEVVVIGTKEPPVHVGSGNFFFPTTSNSIFTSGFRTARRPSHQGVDLANSVGTPIYAADSGTVIKSSSSGAYGNLIIIDHGNGYTTRYAHLSGYNVTVGQTVKRGQVIGYMGNTGRSSGPHLHFEIRSGGQPTNPEPQIGLN